LYTFVSPPDLRGSLLSTEPSDRERTEERNGDVARGTIFPVLKVLRQCPLVLLVKVLHVIGINFYVTLEACITVKF
jgi:hypothetical protein